MPRKRTGRIEWPCGVPGAGRAVAVLSVTIDGKRTRPRYDLGTTDPKLAETRLTKLLVSEPAVQAPSRAPTPTFAVWSETWLKRRKIKASYASECGWIRRWAQPVLGPKLLGDIKTSDVELVIEKARQAGLVRQTLVHIRATIRRCLKRAQHDEHLEANPAALAEIETEREVRKERAILTDEEVLTLIACSDVDLEIRLLSLCARAEGGMRTRDLTAWSWSHFDLPGLSWCVVPRTKTAKPQKLEIPDVLAPSLRAWWRRAGEPTTGPVFPVTKGKRKGEPRRAQGVSFAKRLRRALLDAGIDRHELHHETEATLRVDFHSFRRAWGTALVNAGVPEREAMRLGGWASSQAFGRYVMTGDEARKIPAAALPERRRIDGDVRGMPEDSRVLGRALGQGAGEDRVLRDGGAPLRPCLFAGVRRGGDEELRSGAREAGRQGQPGDFGGTGWAPVVTGRMDAEWTPRWETFAISRSGTRGSNSRPSAWEADGLFARPVIAAVFGPILPLTAPMITWDHLGISGNGRERPLVSGPACPVPPANETEDLDAAYASWLLAWCEELDAGLARLRAVEEQHDALLLAWLEEPELLAVGGAS